MKLKLFGLLFALASVFCFTGCDETPDAKVVEGLAYAGGKAAGLVCEMTKVDQEVKDSINKVLDELIKVVPAKDATFEATWTPIIEAEIAKLIESGKLKDVQGVLVKGALQYAVSGLDYLFTKHAKWKEYSNIVSVAVNGFVGGFKSVFASDTVAASTDYDKDMYEYLKKLDK